MTGFFGSWEQQLLKSSIIWIGYTFKYRERFKPNVCTYHHLYTNVDYAKVRYTNKTIQSLVVHDKGQEERHRLNSIRYQLMFFLTKFWKVFPNSISPKRMHPGAAVQISTMDCGNSACTNVGPLCTIKMNTTTVGGQWFRLFVQNASYERSHTPRGCYSSPITEFTSYMYTRTICVNVACTGFMCNSSTCTCRA